LLLVFDWPNMAVYFEWMFERRLAVIWQWCNVFWANDHLCRDL